MANTLGNYNPTFYAQEALIWLKNALGLANRVHRGYELERRAFNKGQTISIRKPGTFVAEDPISTTQDLDPENVDILLNNNPGVRFGLTDVELAYTDEQIISEHIQPAVYAIANHIDRQIAAEYVNVPWIYDYGTATDHTIITGAQMIAFQNGVPVDDGMLHMMVDPTVRMYFQNSAAFSSADMTGPGNNSTLFRGTLGERYGTEIFGSQNVKTHTPGTVVSGADQLGALTANLAKGATTMAVGSLGAGTDTLKAGDTFSIAGNTQRYAVIADIAMVGGAATVAFTPPAAQAYSSGAVVTFYVQGVSAQQLLFHRNAFAFAMARLPSNLPGIEVSVAQDEDTGLALRARRWSVGLDAKTYIAIDALYGVKTLDGNLAVRAYT